MKEQSIKLKKEKFKCIFCKKKVFKTYLKFNGFCDDCNEAFHTSRRLALSIIKSYIEDQAKKIVEENLKRKNTRS